MTNQFGSAGTFKPNQLQPADANFVFRINKDEEWIFMQNKVDSTWKFLFTDNGRKAFFGLANLEYEAMND